MILVVDDYIDSARALCILLKAQGFSTEWLASGPEAVAFVHSHSGKSPLLLVLDQMMPLMTGIEVLRLLRNDSTTRGTAVIMFSAGCDDAAREEATELGVMDWLLKGQDLSRLLKAIEKAYIQVGGSPTDGLAH